MLRLTASEVVASFALTEPEARSDPSRITTTARCDRDGWILNGLKRYITNVPSADVFMVFARTDADAVPGREIGVFIVPSDTQGVHVEGRDRKIGEASAWTADAAFDDARVPNHALIGDDAHSRFGTAMRSLALTIASVCVESPPA